VGGVEGICVLLSAPGERSFPLVWRGGGGGGGGRRWLLVQGGEARPPQVPQLQLQLIIPKMTIGNKAAAQRQLSSCIFF